MNCCFQFTTIAQKIVYYKSHRVNRHAPLPTVKLSGVSQPVSIEYKVEHGLINLCLEPKISKCQQSWIRTAFSYVLEQVSDATMSEKNWIIFVFTSQK